MRNALFFRPLAVLSLLLFGSGLVAADFGAIHSGLVIEPGKQFILGGSQPGTFKVVAT